MTHVAIGLNKFWVILFWWFMVYVLNVNGVSCTGRAIFKHGERSVLHVTVIRTERTPVAQWDIRWGASSRVKLFRCTAFFPLFLHLFIIAKTCVLSVKHIAEETSMSISPLVG